MKSPERVAHLVVLKFQTTLFAVPLRVASDFEAESFVVAESVFVFQFLPDRDFETATFPPLNRVLVASDVGTEFASVLLVVEANLRFADHWKSSISKTPVRRWVGVLAFLVEGEERPPRFAVLARDLLDSRASDDTVVLSTVLGSVPHVAVTEVVLTTFVG